MKKLFAGAISVVLMLLMCLPCLGAGSFTLKAVQAEPVNGCDNFVAVCISEKSDVYTVEFKIKYDTQVMEYAADSAALGDASKNVHAYFSVNEQEEGTITASYTGTEPLENGGVLCGFGFKSKAKDETKTRVDIEFDHAETFDGRHIRRLDCTATGVELIAAKQIGSPTAAIALAAAGGVAIVAAVVIILVKRKRSTK